MPKQTTLPELVDEIVEMPPQPSLMDRTKLQLSRLGNNLERLIIDAYRSKIVRWTVVGALSAAVFITAGLSVYSIINNVSDTTHVIETSIPLSTIVPLDTPYEQKLIITDGACERVFGPNYKLKEPNSNICATSYKEQILFISDGACRRMFGTGYVLKEPNSNICTNTYTEQILNITDGACRRMFGTGYVLKEPNSNICIIPYKEQILFISDGACERVFGPGYVLKEEGSDICVPDYPIGPFREHHPATIGTGPLMDATYSDGMAPYSQGFLDSYRYRIQIINQGKNPDGCGISMGYADKIWFGSSVPTAITINNIPIAHLNAPTDPHGYIFDYPINPHDIICVTDVGPSGFYFVFGIDLYYHYDSYCVRNPLTCSERRIVNIVELEPTQIQEASPTSTSPTSVPVQPNPTSTRVNFSLPDEAFWSACGSPTVPNYQIGINPDYLKQWRNQGYNIFCNVSCGGFGEDFEVDEWGWIGTIEGCAYQDYDVNCRLEKPVGNRIGSDARHTFHMDACRGTYNESEGVPPQNTPIRN